MNPRGICAACNEPVFDIQSVKSGTGDSRVDGTPAAVGMPDQNAFLITLVMVDGVQCTITVHGTCKDLSSGRFKNVWRNLREQELACHDDSYRVAAGGKPMTPEQRAKSGDRLARFVSNPPIGILCAQPWQEIIDGR